MSQKYFISAFLPLATLMLCFLNCSGYKAQVDLASVDMSAAVDKEYVSIGTDGVASAFQDKMFRYSTSDTLAGATITLQNAPSWLQVDSTNSEVYGVPTEIQTVSNVTITLTKGSEKKTVGPFSIKVIGDPLRQYQWHLYNTGQSTFAANAGTSGEDIHLTDTIANRILGEGIRIAVSDTGVDETHPGLSPNLISGASRNYLQSSSNGSWTGASTPSYSEAEYSHGTAVAGLIAQRGWTGYGGRGVAPFAKFAGFLFIQAQEQLTSNGNLTLAMNDQFQGDFDIFNYSWGNSQCALYEETSVLKEKMKYGVISLRSGRGAIYVKAAGNDYVADLSDCYSSSSGDVLGNANFTEDATTPYTVVIGALNADGLSSSYSSPGSNIWVSAPGGEYGWSSPSSASSVAKEPAMLTTDFIGCSYGMKTGSKDHNSFDAGQSPNTNCAHTSTMNGTSSATPVTSGAIALILSANPALTWRDVKYILAKTADQVDASVAAQSHPSTSLNLSGHVYEQAWVTNAAGYHFHNWYGFGRVNVDKAVQMAKNYSSNLGTLQDLNWKYDSGTLGVKVPAGSATGVSKTLSVSENYSVEAVQVKVTAKSCIGNLGIELTSPSGTKSIVMNINSLLQDSSIDAHTFLSNAFYGESSAGTWTMKLIGGSSSCTTTWTSWQLNILGH